MNAVGADPAFDAEVARVARALFQRGAVREGAAMLRGAVARDHTAERCRGVLEAAQRGEAPAAPGEAVELDLPLVDRWIREGMLVEALALLGGTPMGSLETGREWANLLGELLAPVPVDADTKLAAVHQQLLTGGASVALSLLEERAREAPPPPAWALRRLELLRWMLLDNATAAEEAPSLPAVVPSELAGSIRDAIHQRDLRGAAESARAFAAAHPGPDAVRTADALDALVAEVELQVSQASTQQRTIPIFGRPAAALQLQMCNLTNALAVYARLLDQDPGDLEAQRLREDLVAVTRALAGEPVADDSWDDATTHVGSAEGAPDTEPPGPPDVDLVAGLAGVAPPGREAPEKSGPMAVLDLGPTEQMPDADAQLERLIAEGRLQEAEDIHRAMARLFPQDESHVRRADELRALRLGTGARRVPSDPDADVVVHEIRSVK